MCTASLKLFDWNFRRERKPSILVPESKLCAKIVKNSLYID